MSPTREHGPVDSPVHDPPLPEEESLDGERLRAVMRHVASPVTVVTAASGGEARGATIGSFTSVSLAPPLVSFNITRGSGFHDVMRVAESFKVHVLRDDQSDLAEHFARPDLTPQEQFENVPVRDDPKGTSPILTDVSTVLHCRVWHRYPAGDHDIVVGLVEDVEVQPGGDGHPLLYYARSYRAIGDEV